MKEDYPCSSCCGWMHWGEGNLFLDQFWAAPFDFFLPKRQSTKWYWMRSTLPKVFFPVGSLMFEGVYKKREGVWQSVEIELFRAVWGPTRPCRPFQVLLGGSINIITRLSCSPVLVDIYILSSVNDTFSDHWLWICVNFHCVWKVSSTKSKLFSLLLVYCTDLYLPNRIGFGKYLLLSVFPAAALILKYDPLHLDTAVWSWMKYWYTLETCDIKIHYLVLRSLVRNVGLWSILLVFDFHLIQQSIKMYILVLVQNIYPSNI